MELFDQYEWGELESEQSECQQQQQYECVWSPT